MASDMVGGFMSQNESQFVLVPRIGNQGQRECDERATAPVGELECVRRLIWAVIHDNSEIAIQLWCLPPTLSFRNRLHSLHHGDKVARGKVSRPGRALRRRGWRQLRSRSARAARHER